MIEVEVTVRTVRKVTVDEGNPKKARAELAKAIADASGAKAKDFESDLNVPVAGQRFNGRLSTTPEGVDEVAYEFFADPATQNDAK